MNVEVAWEPVKKQPYAGDESIEEVARRLPHGVYFVSKSEIGRQACKGALKLIVKRQEEKK